MEDPFPGLRPDIPRDIGLIAGSPVVCVVSQSSLTVLRRRRSSGELRPLRGRARSCFNPSGRDGCARVAGWQTDDVAVSADASPDGRSLHMTLSGRQNPDAGVFESGALITFARDPATGMLRPPAAVLWSVLTPPLLAGPDVYLATSDWFEDAAALVQRRRDDATGHLAPAPAPGACIGVCRCGGWRK
jgi:hypothetical protein